MESRIAKTLEDLESRDLNNLRLPLEEKIELVDYLISKVTERLNTNCCFNDCYLCHETKGYLLKKDKISLFTKIHILERSVAVTYNLYSNRDSNDTLSVVIMWFCLPELLEYYPESGLKGSGGWFKDNETRLQVLLKIQKKIKPIGQ